MAYVGLPPGSIAQFAGAVAPTGWLVCDGSAVSRTTYADLFAAIGTQYGTGDGSSTFNLPDGQGRSLVGQGTHSDVGTLGGNEGASLSARRQRHKHSITDPGHTHSGVPATPGGDTGTGGFYGYNFASYSIPTTNTASATTNIGVGPQSGNEPTDSGAYLVVRHIIKV